MDFNFGDWVDEAAERSGLLPAALTADHLNSIKRSTGLVLLDLEKDGARPEFRVETMQIPVSAGQRGVFLPQDTIDVLQLQWRNAQGLDQPVMRTTRDDYGKLADKAQGGVGSFPMSFWLSKSMPAETHHLTSNPQGWGQSSWGGSTWGGNSVIGAGSPTGDVNLLVLWPIPGVAGTLIIDRLRRFQAPNMLGDQVDARDQWLDVMCYGLAFRLAEKWNPEREDKLEARYMRMKRERLESEDRGAVVVGFKAFGRSRAPRY